MYVYYSIRTGKLFVNFCQTMAPHHGANIRPGQFIVTAFISGETGD